MAYTVNWITKVISIPTTDLTLVSGTRYSLLMTEFANEVRRLEWEPTEGLWAPAILDHTNTKVDFAGSDYAPFDDIINGYTVQFTGVATRVDLIGSNTNLIDALIPTGISVVPSNSAGLISSDAIKKQSFLNAEVFINTKGRGVTGTLYPRGTPPLPSNNYADAKLIAESNNYNKYRLDGTMVFGVSETTDNTSWFGLTPITSLMAFTGQDSDGMSIERCGVAGTFSPTATSLRMSLNQSALGNVTDFYGVAFQTGLNGIVNIYNGSTTEEEVIFDQCFSAIGGNVKPVVNINGMPSEVQFRHYSGGLKITNATHASFKMSIDGEGRLEIDSTCTQGVIVVGGTWEIIDNSGPGCTVVTASNVADLVAAGSSVWTEQEKLDTITYSKKASDNAEQANLKL